MPVDSGPCSARNPRVANLVLGCSHLQIRRFPHQCGDRWRWSDQPRIDTRRWRFRGPPFGRIKRQAGERSRHSAAPPRAAHRSPRFADRAIRRSAAIRLCCSSETAGLLVFDQVAITFRLGPSAGFHGGARGRILAEAQGFASVGSISLSVVNFDSLVALLAGRDAAGPARAGLSRHLVFLRAKSATRRPQSPANRPPVPPASKSGSPAGCKARPPGFFRSIPSPCADLFSVRAALS